MPDARHHRSDTHHEAPKCAWRIVLRRSDQAVIAGFVGIGLIGLIGWIVRLGGPGQTIELERATERHASYQIDMNRADWIEWTELPGIGEGIAHRIVESRETDGPFISHDDLVRVKGIGPKTMERIRPYLLPEPGTQQNMVGTP